MRPTNVGGNQTPSRIDLSVLRDEAAKPDFPVCGLVMSLVHQDQSFRFFKSDQKTGYITITHRDITRYFMATSEASQLVIQASAMATGRGEVFVLDMVSL